jgi:hypothetical protein
VRKTIWTLDVESWQLSSQPLASLRVFANFGGLTPRWS